MQRSYRIILSGLIFWTTYLTLPMQAMPREFVGFDSLAAPTSQNVVMPGGTTATATYEQIYNYHSYGARIGHMQLSHARNRAPEILSYLDIVFGPYSNLESFICRPTDHVEQRYKPAGSGCLAVDPTLYKDDLDAAKTGLGVGPFIRDSRKRLNRLDLEGLLKIPATPLYVGFNANIGQHSTGSTALDPAFAAPDDVRFFFGTKFDIASFLQRLNLGPK